MQAKNAPRYQQIAADIAAKIAGGEYKIGDKIFARSSLASQYHVSSETARRAICVLCDSRRRRGDSIAGERRNVCPSI